MSYQLRAVGSHTGVRPPCHPADVVRALCSPCYTAGMTLMLLGLAWATAATAATPPAVATTPAVEPAAKALPASTVNDGGVPRRITRPRRGSDGAPVVVDYQDPATGRRTAALLGSTAIIQLATAADGEGGIEAVADRHGLRVERPLMARAGLWLVRGGDGEDGEDGEDGVDIAVRLQAANDSDVREVFPNLAFEHRTMAPAQAFVPNDPRYGAQFFFRELQMEGAWLITQGSADVVVSVIDNGCDEAHPDLAEKLLQGHDVITDDENPAFTPNSQGNEHGTACAGLVALTEPFAQWISGGGSSQWFLYGFLYTVAVCVMGARMAMRYRHNRYQLIRTASVMFFQFAFGFTLPQVLKAFSQPEYYFTYFWPLKYDYLFPGSIDSLMSSGALGVFMVFWGLGAAFVATPILTYFYGKRWYCSWVCGCGGLAETAGDPFRQLSNKSRAAWRFERWSIHLVLVLITVTTIAVWVDARTSGAVFGAASKHLKEAYGFYVGAVLSGVIGVGFYPLLGTRVWCRFFCPMAAVLGLLQRFFSRFRITTNGAQCISCGNCSTYCEMGIDVRAYAQRGENIVRASCVGCGVCAAVCPRGVLKLENGSTHADRFAGSDHPLEALMRSLRQP